MIAVLVKESRLPIDQKVVAEVVTSVAEDGKVSPVDIGISLLALSEVAPGIMSLEGLPDSITSLHLSDTGITSLEGLPSKLQKLTLVAGQVQSLQGLTGSSAKISVTQPTFAALIATGAADRDPGG